jgi:alkylation response protein AidB-like acyl-CoA dehydrogenase
VSNVFDAVTRDTLLPAAIHALQVKAYQIAADHIDKMAGRVDSEGLWPEHSFAALAAGGLMGLVVPKECGGIGEGMLALAVVTEALAESCSSSALCFGMHCVGSATLSAKATPDQKERFLEPIAAGKHITTLALSESGTGSNFWISETEIARAGEEFVINGGKQFVTSGGHADSYVLSGCASPEEGQGVFNMVVLEGDHPGISWTSGWSGFGMRGNSSRSLSLRQVRIPASNLLGAEGEELWFVFEIIVPYFLTAMAATYLGVAQAAFDIALSHIKLRSFSNSGEKLQENPIIQTELAELWMQVQNLRTTLYAACIAGDRGAENALPHILAAKARAASIAVEVCNRAMTLGGGAAYRENAKLARLLRDARAADVMAPTTYILRQWTGKALLGIPLL